MDEDAERMESPKSLLVPSSVLKKSLGGNMPVKKLCKGGCGRSIIVWNSAQTRCADCQNKRSKAKPPTPLKRSTKPIKKKGKATIVYERWRDVVAKPYLDKRFGHVCFAKECDAVEALEVDHIKTRGARHDLKMDVKNVRYLCHGHHRLVTDGAKLSFKKLRNGVFS